MHNLLYLHECITDLEKDNKYLPAFLLKCQIIEYDLKRFIWNYCKLTNNYPKSGLTENFIRSATIEKILKKLNDIDDSVVDLVSLIRKIKDFKKIRNKFVHEIISLNINPLEVEKECKEYIKFADELLIDTWGRLEWINDFYRYK